MKKIMDFEIKAEHLDLKRTLFSGQCFRFTDNGDGSYFGIVGARELTVRQGIGAITLVGAEAEDVPFWSAFFDMETDYGAARERLSADPTLSEACRYADGLRLLRQEPFETLISFIISQNNNIKRITGIVGRLCESFGEKTAHGFAFPTAERLAAETADGLAPLRAGFRARYIIDAARRVSSGELALGELYDEDYETAKARLKTVTGVGEKVADCVLLFAYGKHEAFPKDVWIKRALAKYYPDGLPECIRGMEGLAQQYLFEYIRNNYKDERND